MPAQGGECGPALTSTGTQLRREPGTHMDKYDLVIIGSGPAGQRAAIQAAKLDRKVVGFSGPKSFIRNVTSRSEQYIEDGAAGAVQQARENQGVQR